jgi:hypothetical protein
VNETEIARLADGVAALRLVYLLIHERKKRMSRLTDKLTQAAAVAPRQAAKIEARADAIIAREPRIEQRTDEVFSPHEAVLAEAEHGLDTLDHSLRQMSNADPLQASGGSSSPPPLPQAGAAQSTDAGR